MAIYAIFNVATQNRNLVDVRMRGFYVEKVYCPLFFLYNLMSGRHIDLYKGKFKRQLW